MSLVPAQSLVSNRYDTVGADLLYDKGRLLWRNEIFQSFEKGKDDRLAFYTQPAVPFGDRWLAFYRFDCLDPGQDLDKSTEHVLGTIFLPIPTVRLPAAYFYNYKTFEDPSAGASIVQLSATIVSEQGGGAS